MTKEEIEQLITYMTSNLPTIDGVEQPIDALYKTTKRVIFTFVATTEHFSIRTDLSLDEAKEEYGRLVNINRVDSI